MLVLGLETRRRIEERRIRGIAKQTGLLKSEIRHENKKNIIFFLLGLAAGMLTNILVELLRLFLPL